MPARLGDPEDEDDLDEDEEEDEEKKKEIDDGDEKNFPMDDPDRDAA